MRKNFEDLTGETFGRLTALEYMGQRHNKSSWRCICSCGTEKVVSKDKLKSGDTVSCGCYNREWLLTNEPNCWKGTVFRKHGRSKSKEYDAWQAAKTRCYSETYFAYDRYGGRGIQMADCWLDDFEAFYRDVGPAPSRDHWLDRIDNEKGYCPGNVHWATAKRQNRNKSSNVMIEIDGISRCMSEWCEINGVHRATAHYRIKKGMDPAKAVTLPPDLSKSRNRLAGRQAHSKAAQR